MARSTFGAGRRGRARRSVGGAALHELRRELESGRLAAAALASSGLREVRTATALALVGVLPRWKVEPVHVDDERDIGHNRDRHHPEGRLRDQQDDEPDDEDHVRPERPRSDAELGRRRRARAPVVPNDIRDERDADGDHRGPVETGFAVERLEETVNEVLGIERHGVAILAALRALLSVSDRTGLVAFARALSELGWDLIATDGTRAALASEGITARSVEDITGSPALLGGRVKTLHPKIHAALLAQRDDPGHREELAREGIEPIDLVAVNLYPFAEAVHAGKSGTMLLEQIDIGGVTLLRAAAKNYEQVVVIARPERYAAVLDELKQRSNVSLETRRVLASEAFSHTAAYDAAVASRFASEAGVQFPDELTLSLRKVRDLRYGENPHQQAAMYAVRGEDGAMTAMQQLHGKATSFNNMLDINAAWRVAIDFAQPTVAIIKHQNPSGVASDNEITKAYRRAFMCDSVSAFGGIVGANRIVTRELAEAMEGTFYEAIIAPGYEDEALPTLRQRKNLEILAVPGHAIVGGRLARKDGGAFDYKRIAGGMLVQTPDESAVDEGNFKVATERTPSLEELTDLLFAWRCVKHVTSNAIVLARGLATVGVGPGQMSRVVAVETAVRKAGENARLAVMASDAYFPFPDGIEVAARAGVTAIIQPGGSLRDAMMIDTANKNRMAMLFTGRRHFKH